ncbi:MAG: SDR family oxidoreductase [Desulfobacteraceae bacterium]|nr:SDR family oxidoreductase [Desulfobacteraceae bacterium]
MLRDLAGKKALVTGAARRIGRAVAMALAREGADVVIQFMSGRAEALDTCRAISALGARCWPLEADFSSGTGSGSAGYEGLVERAGGLAGGIDILVNNASVFPANTLYDVTLKNFQAGMEVNAWAPLVLSRNFARLFGKGMILNMIDTRVTGFDWTHAAYIWSKHVLLSMTRMMAVEFAPGIAVNGISPGLILPPSGKDETYFKAMEKTVPLKKSCTAEEVADIAMVLLKSEFITGEVIRVDGGRHLWEYVPGQHPD